ncbi:MAG: agmatinase family protein [Chitinophagales bacterium]|nr:agmatinase family protein [Chitinophagales bacterium]
MSKEEKIKNYNPSGVGVDNGNIFGLPFSFEDSNIIILPVPWEVTTSFGNGTSKAPAKILEASPQLDLFHHTYPNAWKQGIYMLDVSEEILQLNNKYKVKAQEVILLLEKGKAISELQETINEINEVCNQLRKWVFEQATTLLNRNKKVILLGGDHSTPLGYMQALAQKHSEFGILQIDAHADLRKAYEGFTYSHASIIYNAVQIEQIKSLTQVGIRDICAEEVDFINNNNTIHCFYDEKLKEEQYSGTTWKDQVEQIVATLPQKVYISFDIDGLDPKLCPNTGTPVAGGFEFQEAIYLMKKVKESGRTIIGCDLNEVGNNTWDANVGARVLYQLCCFI